MREAVSSGGALSAAVAGAPYLGTSERPSGSHDRCGPMIAITSFTDQENETVQGRVGGSRVHYSYRAYRTCQRRTGDRTCGRAHSKVLNWSLAAPDPGAGGTPASSGR